MFDREGRSISSDHKPLTFALAARSDRYSPRQIRHLDLISQYTSDIRHVKGPRGRRLVGISAVATGGSPPVIDFRAMADVQASDWELQQLRPTTSLKLEAVPLAMSDSTILCEGVSSICSS